MEAVACPLVLPNAKDATLGKVIARLRDAPEKFAVSLTPRRDFNTVEVVRKMCELLWTAQFDRHGTDDESVPLTVSLKEAETALHLSAALVHWFATGSFRVLA